MPLTWSKALSISDAQKPAGGGGSRMRFIPLTSGDQKVPFQTWFRNQFFGGLSWKPAVSRGRALERVEVDFRVKILGKDRGVRTMLAEHRKDRGKNNSAPNTHLKYDDATITDLENVNVTGRRVHLDRDDDGNFHFAI